MARRERDYAAEYARRQARSEAQYGISYNRQRRIVERGRAKGIPTKDVRNAMAKAKSEGRSAADVGRIISADRRRGSAYVDEFEYDVYGDLDIPEWWAYSKE